MAKPDTLLRVEERGEELRFQHPLNPNSEILGHQLSRRVGLKRAAVNLMRVPPGKESFVYHSHQSEEEWLYILSGRAIAEIEDDAYEVGPGDFLGFPTPSVGHHLRNPFEEEVVYLCGGEMLDLEVADYPRHGLRLIRRPDRAEVVPLDAVKRIG
jgi:uncharacterized cupin superfamily protein